MIAFQRRKKRMTKVFWNNKIADSHDEPPTEAPIAQTRDSLIKSDDLENNGLDSRKTLISSISIDQYETKLSLL